MPIKWTPDVDQHLLLKILETHSISIDYQALVDAWSYGDTKPTKKAITERLGRLRKNDRNATGSGSAKSTPQKPRAPKSSKTTPSKTPTKRKRPAVDDSDEDTGPNDYVDSCRIKIKEEKLPEEDEAQTPSKAPRIAQPNIYHDNSPLAEYDPNVVEVAAPQYQDLVGGFDGAVDAYPTPAESQELW